MTRPQTLPDWLPADVERLARACLMASFEGTIAPAWLVDEVADGLGSVCLFSPNIESDDQVAELIATLRRARRDVVIAIDEEGGDVTRLDAHTGSLTPGNAALGALDDVGATAAAHRMIGRRLMTLGVDLNLAPCGDVNVAAANPVIGVRSFGDDPALVARHVAAAIDGLQSVGVAACVKHYPGHGATVDDSHQSLPVITDDVESLKRREFVPVAAAVAAGAAAIMTAHIVVPAGDDAPATRSRRVLGMLRDGLGFDGVIVSDALDMAGVHGPDVAAGDVTPLHIGYAAIASLGSGCDLLCLGARQGPEVPATVVRAIVCAVAAGDLSLDRLASAARRCASLRARCQPQSAALASDDETAVAEVARSALTVGRATLGAIRGALIVDCRPTVSAANFDVSWGLGSDVVALDPTASTMNATDGIAPTAIVERALDRPLVITVRGAAAHPWQQRLVDALAIARPDVVVVELGWPAPDRETTLTTWGASRASTRAVAELLTGEAARRVRSPSVRDATSQPSSR